MTGRTVATEPAADGGEFYDHVRAGELAILRCASCGTFNHPPLPWCPRCQSVDQSWQVVSGRATVYAFSRIHRSFVPSFRDATPYAVGWFELEEQAGLRLLAGYADEATPIEIGLPVRVDFVSDDRLGSRPVFRSRTR